MDEREDGVMERVCNIYLEREREREREREFLGKYFSFVEKSMNNNDHTKLRYACTLTVMGLYKIIVFKIAVFKMDRRGWVMFCSSK